MIGWVLWIVYVHDLIHEMREILKWFRVFVYAYVYWWLNAMCSIAATWVGLGDCLWIHLLSIIRMNFRS